MPRSSSARDRRELKLRFRSVDLDFNSLGHPPFIPFPCARRSFAQPTVLPCSRWDRGFAQSWQHLLRVEPEKSLLIGTRGVED